MLSAITGIAVLFLAIAAAPADTYYVATNGLDSADGTNWATALLTISNAVAKTTGGDTIIISNGTYNITTQINIITNITVKSQNGFESTIVKRDPAYVTRIFYMKHADAVLDGFTITNGYPIVQEAFGGGVRIHYSGGTVQNCLITGNFGRGLGGGVYMHAGIVQFCTIRGNRCYLSDKSGAGVACRNGGTVRNCLIVDNKADLNGGGVYLREGGTVESCTISGNTGLGAGGGIYSTLAATTGPVINTIIYFNTSPDGENHKAANGSVIVYSNNCTTPAVSGTGNITNDPAFRNAGAEDYRLQASS